MTIRASLTRGLAASAIPEALSRPTTKRGRSLVYAAWLTGLLSLQLPAATFQKEESIPFIIMGEHLIAVKASSGSMKNGIFIIDTGTLHTIIDEHVVSELELPVRKWDTATGALNRLGPATLEMASLPDFRMGPLHIRSLTVQSRRLGEVGAVLGKHIDGFIGMDVLQNANFCIDFDSRKIRFGSWSPEAEGISGKPDLPFLIITAWINGQPLKLKLDTGICHIVLFEERMANELRRQPVVEQRLFSSAMGLQALSEIKLDQLRIGTAVWKNPPRCFVTMASDHGLDYDGLLGVAQLGFKRVYLDFETNCLRWER